VSLQKITYESTKKKVFYHTKYNEYWGENVKLFKASDFIAELTQHIPPKHKHLIRYYGLYSSRTKGKAKQVGRYEKFGIKVNAADETALTDTEDYKEVMDSKGSKRAWTRLIQKIYEIDPFICPLCESEMKIIAVIQDKSAIEKIISHLEKKRAPPEEMLVS
jgi:hypothetical protein